MPEAHVVVVTGIPGSGKTTLAGDLAPALGMALISKDTIKEALFDALGSGDLDWSRSLGRAAHTVMYALAREAGPVVLESFFWPGVAEPELRRLGRPLVQVWCDCPVDVAVDRYLARVASPERHSGHAPEHQTRSVISSWADAEPRPLDLDAPLVRVDTSVPVDPADLVARVRAALAEISERRRRPGRR